MSDFTIIIGNKNYSTWSLRPWLALKHTGVAFEEVLVVLGQDDTPENLKKVSPTGKVPVLKTPVGDIWDSLAICEYLAETFPEARLWPEAAAARAHARAVSAEMHSGFATVRSMMPMDLRTSQPTPGMTGGLATEISRIDQVWQECRNRFGQGGPYLFGSFSIADCMFAPVVGRFAGYGVSVSDVSQNYINTMFLNPGMAEWVAAAKVEPWEIEQ